MTAEISDDEIRRIAAEQIGCDEDVVDTSYVCHALESKNGVAFLPDDAINRILVWGVGRDPGPDREAIYRIGRSYYLRSWSWGYIQSSNWKHLVDPMRTVEEVLAGERGQGVKHPELKRPDEKKHPELAARPDDPAKEFGIDAQPSSEEDTVSEHHS